MKFYISILLFLLFISCKNNEQLVYHYKMFEYQKGINTPNRFFSIKNRTKYDIRNDSTIILLSIIDSIKPWDSNDFIAERIESNYDERYMEMIPIWTKCDSIFSHLGLQSFNFSNISNNTRIIFLNVGEDNDTLLFECKKKYGNLNVYSFICSSCRAYDSGFRAYFCDSIGVLAIYSGPWNNVSVLDNIVYSDELNIKLQKVKTQLIKDSLFFPYANECNENNKAIFISPK